LKKMTFRKPATSIKWALRLHLLVYARYVKKKFWNYIKPNKMIFLQCDCFSLLSVLVRPTHQELKFSIGKVG